MSRESDLLLGKLAVERNLITYDQLKECIREQEREILHGDPEATVGRRIAGRPLGAIMTSLGMITDQQLLDLYDEQRKRIEALRSFRLVEKSEKMIGQLLVSSNKGTQLQINKCLQAQRKLAEQGVTPVPRLGELMVEHGFVNEEEIRELLEQQNKTIMYCAGCNTSYNVVGVQEGKHYRCRKCQATLISEDYLKKLKVDETAMGQDIAEGDDS